MYDDTVTFVQTIPRNFLRLFYFVLSFFQTN